MKTALITGIFGQDGAYLAEYLLNKNYRVIGARRRTSLPNDWRLKVLGIEKKIELVEMDLQEQSNLRTVIRTYRPDELYNLAAQSHVATSFAQPVYTAEVNALPVLYLLEAMREYVPDCRFYQASTSEMFGQVREIPQTEKTPFHPRSPYGVAKLYAHWITTNYREAHGLFATSGILFNHESPLRGPDFVTRKITSMLARIKCGAEEVLELGNLEAERDWGFAGDYVKAKWDMLQHNKPDTFVVATGKTSRVRDFLVSAAAALDIRIVWEGEGVNEIGIDAGTGTTLVTINPKYFRPAEVDQLRGDPSYIQQELGWKPTTTLQQLTEMMVRADYDREKAKLA